MKDTRIFRVTRDGGKVVLCNRQSAGGKAGRGGNPSSIRKIEATNAGCTEGWTDVTREFFPDRSRPLIETLLDVPGDET